MYKLKILESKLQNEISQLRREMIESGLGRGLADQATVQLSQELDELLNKYEKIKMKSAKL